MSPPRFSQEGEGSCEHVHHVHFFFYLESNAMLIEEPGLDPGDTGCVLPPAECPPIATVPCTW